MNQKKKEGFSSRFQKLLESVAEFEDFDYQEFVNKKSFNLGDFILGQDLEKCITLFLSGKIPSSFVSLGYHLESLIENTDMCSINRLKELNQEWIDNATKFWKLVSSFRKLELEFKNEIVPEIIKSIPFGIDSNDVNLDTWLAISDSADIFKLRKIGGNTIHNDKIQQVSSMRFFEKVVIIDDIRSWMSYLKSNPTNENEIKFSLLFCREKLRSEFSYFAITIQIGNEIWIADDRSRVYNPENIVSRRNDRSRHESWSNVILPYDKMLDIVNGDKISDIKKANSPDNGLISLTSVMEMENNERLYFYLLCNELMTQLKQEKSPEIVLTFDEFVSRKLLSGSTLSPTDDVKGLGRKLTKLEKEIVQAYTTESKSSSLMTIHHSEIHKHKMYDPSWMGTEDELNKLANWHLLDVVSQNVISNIKKETNYVVGFQPSTSETDRRKLIDLISKQEDHILSFAMCAKKMYEMRNDVSFGSDNKDRKVLIYQWERSEESKLSQGFYHCVSCKKTIQERVKTWISFRINNYQQFVDILGIERNELPKSYRFFASNICVPYSGNSILDNINPLLDAVERLPTYGCNDYKFSIMLCGRCFNKLIKDVPDEVVVESKFSNK